MNANGSTPKMKDTNTMSFSKLSHCYCQDS